MTFGIYYAHTSEVMWKQMVLFQVMLVQKSGEDDSVKSEEEILHCPICFKTFNCKYDLETHMDTHPDTTLR